LQLSAPDLEEDIERCQNPDRRPSEEEAGAAKKLRPLAKALLEALRALPVEAPVTLYKLLPPLADEFEPLEHFKVGSLLSWSGLLASSSTSFSEEARALVSSAAATKSGEASTSSRPLIAIRLQAKRARSTARVQGWPSQERFVLPDSVFKVTSVGPPTAAEEAELAGCCCCCVLHLEEEVE